MLISAISARHELLALIGQPVRVSATLTRLGGIPGREDREQYATALLNDIDLGGVQAPISHAWVRFGVTGSERLRKLGRKVWGVPIQMDAEITAYRAGDGGQHFRLGLGELSHVIVCVDDRWRTVARGREEVDTDRGERIAQSYIDKLLGDLLYRNQAPLMDRLSARAQSGRVDQACHDMLRRYYGRQEPVTPGQLRHAGRVLEGL